MYLPSCSEGSQKIWLKVCNYLYTRHNGTKFLVITSEILQFYKFKISSLYKSLHVLYINLCKSTTQYKESKHNIFLPKWKIFSWNINYKTELWRSRCQSRVTTGSPFWCPDPPGVHDQILVFILNTDCRSVSDHPHGWACRSLCCRNMCQLFLFTYTQFFFFVFPCIYFFIFWNYVLTEYFSHTLLKIHHIF